MTDKLALPTLPEVEHPTTVYLAGWRIGTEGLVHGSVVGIDVEWLELLEEFRAADVSFAGILGPPSIRPEMVAVGGETRATIRYRAGEEALASLHAFPYVAVRAYVHSRRSVIQFAGVIEGFSVTPPKLRPKTPDETGEGTELRIMLIDLGGLGVHFASEPKQLPATALPLPLPE